MGRKKKPSAIRILEGNRGHRPIPEEVEVEGAAICPRGLSKRAKKEWKYLAPELRKMGLLTKLDQGNFAIYCEGVADLEEYQKIIREDGKVLTAPDGRKQLHPAIGALDRLKTQQRQYSAMFGLDASSRAGLPVVESQEPDEFELWLARKRARRPDTTC